MRTTYNLIAGQSLDRLSALSDGIFAVAMTLLVLDLRVPLTAIQNAQSIVVFQPSPLWVPGAFPLAIQVEGLLWQTLVQLAPRLLTYFMSFLTLGIFWLGQQTQLNQFARGNRNLVWIHLIFLFAVSLMPFSTMLLADFITFRLALIVYWLNLLLLGVMLFASIRYAGRAGLLKEETTPELRDANERRIVTYQAPYAFGALLCVISTYVSIAFIVLLQLNSVIAPRIRPLDRF